MWAVAVVGVRLARFYLSVFVDCRTSQHLPFLHLTCRTPAKKLYLSHSVSILPVTCVRVLTCHCHVVMLSVSVSVVVFVEGLGLGNVEQWRW